MPRQRSRLPMPPRHLKGLQSLSQSLPSQSLPSVPIAADGAISSTEMATGLHAQRAAGNVDLETLIKSVQLMLKAASHRRPIASARAVAEITMLAARHCPLASLRSAGADEHEAKLVIEHWEQIVYSRYAFRKARRFSTDASRRSTAQAVRLIVMVVSSLVSKNKVDIEALHQECGWE